MFVTIIDISTMFDADFPSGANLHVGGLSTGLYLCEFVLVTELFSRPFSLTNIPILLNPIHEKAPHLRCFLVPIT